MALPDTAAWTTLSNLQTGSSRGEPEGVALEAMAYDILQQIQIAGISN